MVFSAENELIYVRESVKLKRLTALALVLILLFSWTVPATAGASREKELLKLKEQQILNERKNSEVLVRYKDSKTKGKKFSSRVQEKISERKQVDRKTELLRLGKADEMDQIVAELKKDPDIALVEKNTVRRFTSNAVPNVAEQDRKSTVEMNVYEIEAAKSEMFNDRISVRVQETEPQESHLDTADYVQNRLESGRLMSVGNEVWEVEPNDSPTLADPFTIGDYVFGTFGQLDDLDGYEVTIQQSGTLDIVGVAGPYGQYFTLGLYDEYGEIIGWTSTYYDSSDDLYFQALSAQVTPGTYYVVGMTWDETLEKYSTLMVGQTYGFTTNLQGTGTAVTGVALNKDSATILKGKTETLIASVFPATATNQQVIWSSSDISVATVNSSGVVTAVAEGKAYVNVTTAEGAYTASCEITVLPVLEGSNVFNDPMYYLEWGFGAIKIPEAWQNVSSAQRTIKVAVIDSGLEMTHEDLQNRIASGGYNFILGSNEVYDVNGHGTAVSGVISAQANNGKGIAGVAGVLDVKVLPLQAAYYDGSMYLSEELAAIDYAIQNDVDIINISYGSLSYSEMEQQAILEAVSKGITVVVAAGNEGRSIYAYPASYDGVISVGSVSTNLNVSSFSNFNNKVDLVAPGESILTTSLDNSYSYMNGTSFSAPMVAGVVAVMKATNPQMTPDSVLSILTQTAADKGAIGRDNYYGYGLINAQNAVFKTQNLSAVSLDKASLAIGFTSGETASSVTQNLTLPTVGSNGTIISWSSSDTGVINNNGIVIRPPSTASNVTVTLTATITKGAEADTKQFTVTVMKKTMI